MPASSRRRCRSPGRRRRRGLGELGSDVDLREHRHRAGGHAVDRRAALGRRPSRRAAARGDARRDPLRARRRSRTGGSEVVRDLNLTIAPGERVGLVGRSGAGKSTLVNLMLRLHDIECGRILIDGQDIAHVTQETPARRDRHGHAGHRRCCIARSLDNIRYGRPDATDRGGRRRPPARRTRTTSSWRCATGTGVPATRRTSASVASSSRAASASASRSRASS